MPLTYCFAGSDIKARWHVAFWERSGAPSRPPVHLHNVATCHMETGITNLCLSLVARWPCYPLLYPNSLPFLRLLLFPLPFFSSPFIFVAFFSCHVTAHVLLRGAFFVNTEKIITVGNRKKKKKDFTHSYRNTHTHMHKASGVLRGTACQHQLWGLWWQREGLILMW